METTFSGDRILTNDYFVFFDLDQTLANSISGKSLAANAFRPRLAQALHRRCGCRAEVGQGELPRGEGLLL